MAVRAVIVVSFAGFMFGLNYFIYLAVAPPDAKAKVLETRASRAPSRPIRTPNEVRLDGGTAVVGLVVKGQPRAYVLAASSSMDSHVFNDYIQGSAISVTYCGLDDYARVFVKHGVAEALKVGMAGRFNERMYCYYDGRPFAQDDREAPLPDHRFERTRWDAWLEEHPHTEVYVGDLMF